MKQMPLEEFVIKSAERYIQLKDTFPNDTAIRFSLTESVIEYLAVQNITREERLEYARMYYKLRGQ